MPSSSNWIARIAAHDVFAALGRCFVELEFDVEAAAVLVRPARRDFRPDGFVFLGAAFNDAVQLVGWSVA
jgi:hypothetical protein